MAGDKKITNITDQIRLECSIQFLAVEHFCFTWGINKHAFLTLEGYADMREQTAGEQDGLIRLVMGKDATLFCGQVVKVGMEHAGRTVKVCLAAKSGSYMLDQKPEARSFQDTAQSYAEVVQDVAGRAGGRVICTAGKDVGIGKPFIQYGETPWAFCMRLASRLGTCIVPDIVTGEKAFWFGLRKGDEKLAFSEEEYTVTVYRESAGGGNGTEYEVESRDFYKIGDRTVFRGMEMAVYRVRAEFQNGELIYRYILREYAAVSPLYLDRFVGLGLRGTVVEVQQEQVRVALDIDGGNSTGEYFYPWYPETGNALYAMPEAGARVLLYFGGRDERDGFILHCLPEDRENGQDYRNRHLATKEGNSLHLCGENVDVSKGGKHSLSVGDDSVGVRSTGKVTVSAKNGVKINASRIFISTPDELDICQG